MFVPKQAGNLAYLADSLTRLGKARPGPAHRPSSRTPEGRYGRCPVCRDFVCVTFSDPVGDAPCPSCGQLLWLHELRWPFVCEDQGLPLRPPSSRRPRWRAAFTVGKILGRVARRLGIGRPARRSSAVPTIPSPPSSSTMYDPWLDG